MDLPGGHLPLSGLEHRPGDDPMVGWRYWLLRPTLHLGSVSHRRIDWQPEEPLRAVCLTGGHVAPSPGCACGIHASAQRAELLGYGLCLAPGVPLVLGRVALWGAVTSDEHGWRGEFAYPVELSLVLGTGDPDPDRTSALLAGLGQYGVPVDTVGVADAVGDVSAAILSFQAMSSPPAP